MNTAVILMVVFVYVVFSVMVAQQSPKLFVVVQIHQVTPILENGVIGNTRGFEPLILSSSLGSRTNILGRSSVGRATVC